jgi:hypothetical protein
MPDDHSKLVPLLPIPNRTVKRLSADDSADSRVKVGHRQALTARKAQLIQSTGLFLLVPQVQISATLPSPTGVTNRPLSLYLLQAYFQYRVWALAHLRIAGIFGKQPHQLCPKRHQALRTHRPSTSATPADTNSSVRS